MDWMCSFLNSSGICLIPQKEMTAISASAAPTL